MWMQPWLTVLPSYFKINYWPRSCDFSPSITSLNLSDKVGNCRHQSNNNRQKRLSGYIIRLQGKPVWKIIFPNPCRFWVTCQQLPYCMPRLDLIRLTLAQLEVESWNSVYCQNFLIICCPLFIMSRNLTVGKFSHNRHFKSESNINN